MVTKFWEGIAEGLAGEWTSRLVGPAVFFWGGGLLAWGYHYGFTLILTWLSTQVIAIYLVLAAGGLLVLAASTVMMIWIQLPLLRLLEGYWPTPLGRRLRFLLTRQVAKRLARKETHWQELARKDTTVLSHEQREKYVRLDSELSTYPVDSTVLLPTSLGNLLRAAETYPRFRYGLEITTVWPRLWLTLPKETQEEISMARQRLNEAIQLLGWGALFAIWTVFSRWALLVAALMVLVAWWRMINAAGVYGDLLRSSFDLYRFSLYEQLHWPLPATPEEEVVCGTQLTQYLHRGLAPKSLTFFKESKK